MKDVSISINGQLVEARVEPRLTLLDFVRDVAGLKVRMLGASMGYAAPVPFLSMGRQSDHA